MRKISYLIEILVLTFMVTTFIFMAKQPVINEAKVKQEADSSSNELLDNLDKRLLEEDTEVTDSVLTQSDSIH